MVPPKRGPAAVKWQPIPRTRAYELVIKRIEEQITSGVLSVGDQLPAERDLAAALGVSRAAVREAMRAMEAQGVVRSGAGVGPDSGTFLTSMPSKALTQFLRLHMALANFPIDDVLETRIMLERRSARLAARQASASDLATMSRLLDEMDAETGDLAVFNELDTDFHVAMAEAAHNTLITEMTTAIRHSMRSMVLASFREHGDWPELAATLRGQHRAIYSAIAVGDQPGAADTVEAHLRSANDVLHWGAGGHED
ncbi:FadR/GntR family transcriptional regulator [Micropruina sonneratiae]|uniref:FadR/GntR family transcriptional regulator n=1 Tax=Micropruina sonneratiae TaxID=2986940 RepID=UPI0022279975|nr:FadR/GntR family transcriptional regulator [Micropruina sp. KQZ13P-5]MCW3156531.1 FadR family transcriptional regulator [Micropruina sp. KQZ13P-5]